jgi:hypothetical protein
VFLVNLEFPESLELLLALLYLVSLEDLEDPDYLENL